MKRPPPEAMASRAKSRKRDLLRPISPQSPFLKLPAELRNAIYEAVLLDETYNGVLSYGTRLELGKPTFRQSRPSLLSVNKQIRAEARPIFFNLNNLYIDTDIDDLPLVRPMLLSRLPKNAKDGSVKVGKVKLHILGEAWSGLRHGLCLAEIVRDYGDCLGGGLVVYCSNDKIESTWKHVAKLGLEAAKDGHDSLWLKEKIDEVVAKALPASHKSLAKTNWVEAEMIERWEGPPRQWMSYAKGSKEVKLL